MSGEKLVNIDLIPVTAYQESEDDVNTKTYTCTRCGRVFAGKHGPKGVKQHILQVHVANGELTLFQATVPESKSKKRKAKSGGNKDSKKPNLNKNPDRTLQSSPTTQSNSLKK